MSHDDAAGLAHRGRDGLPVIGVQGAQVQYLDIDAVLSMRPLGSLQGTRHQGAIGNQSDVRAGPDDLCFTKGNGKLRPRIRRPAIGLPVESLVFQKKHRIVAADCGAQQPVGVQCIRWKDYAQPWNMRKDALAGLRVVDGAAGQIAADGHADHGRSGPDSIRAPAHQRQFIVDLVHGRPDVVEELDFDYRLHPSESVADGPAHDVGFAERRVEDAL